MKCSDITGKIHPFIQHLKSPVSVNKPRRVTEGENILRFFPKRSAVTPVMNACELCLRV